MSAPHLQSKKARLAEGRAYVALALGALAICLLMVFGLLSLLAVEGLGFFWPKEIWALEVLDSKAPARLVYGSLIERKPVAERFDGAVEDGVERYRIKVYRGNRKEYGTGYFEWIDEDRVSSVWKPAELLHVERLEGGPLIGVLTHLLALDSSGVRIDNSPGIVAYRRELATALGFSEALSPSDLRREILATFESTSSDPALERRRAAAAELLARRGLPPLPAGSKAQGPHLVLLLGLDGHAVGFQPEARALMAALRTGHERASEAREAADRFRKAELLAVTNREEQVRLEMKRLAIDASAADRPVDAAALQALQAEQARLNAQALSLAEEWAKMAQVAERESAVFVTAEGIEVAMPLGQIVRVIAPNALGFFGKLQVYGSRVVDFLFGDPREANTEGGVRPQIFGTVMMVLLMSLFVVPFGVLAAIYLREYAKQGPVVRAVRIAVNNLAGTPSIVFGVFGWGFFVLFLGGEIDRLFYPEYAPSPKFGTGGILWASLTLALLTVPVVIVAAEEGLAAVPKDSRAGSLALGATKWETLRRVVIPASSPAILTGTILAMARAAGEVAPLMVVGLQKTATDLPVDFSQAPYIHLERKFMHLGFHIFDLSYQAPDIEYARPQVFASALLLVALVTVINLLAIILRNHLRRRYSSSHV